MKILAGIATLSLLAWGAFQKWYNPPPEEEAVIPTTPPPPPVEPPAPVSAPGTPLPTAVPSLAWDTPKHAWHSVRVICDDVGLTHGQKDDLCACVYQESRFDNHARGYNKNSTDWGIAQVNDTPGWHIGPGLMFYSVQDVLDNPERAIRWMARTLRDTGRLAPWASYTSGAYKLWLSPASPMWLLAK